MASDRVSAHDSLISLMRGYLKYSVKKETMMSQSSGGTSYTHINYHSYDHISKPAVARKLGQSGKFYNGEGIFPKSQKLAELKKSNDPV